MRITRNTFLAILLLLTNQFSQQAVQAQCSSVINTYPYNEGFELDNGNWFPNLTAHWEWGTPVGKAVIPGAAGGSKCWVAGGLSGSAYSSGSSDLVSPCFNFSTLNYPEISFKVFWETERQYDGVTLMYSTDNAATWQTLGAENSDDPCFGIENWFNYRPINFLNGMPGWSGNVQTGGGSCLSGQGSGQWLTARHNLSQLAGQSNVIFKFVFGAGTICNGYDGFAFDDMHIGEAVTSNTADFTYACGANSAVQFTNTAKPCQTGWSWSFGDPLSGPSNFSTDENPTHTFSSGGNYNISLTVTYASGPPVVVPPKNISVVGVTTTNTNIRCNGEQNGAITVNVSPPGSYTYSWNTTPAQFTPTINNLGAGILYFVTVTSANACNVSVSVTLTEPGILVANPVTTPAKCGNNNGTITANAVGGTQPYTYSWSNGQTTPVITGLAPGMYDLSLADMNGCTALPVNNIGIPTVTNNVNPFLGMDTTICPGETLLLDPGSFASYKWQDNSTSATYPVTKTGTYSVMVTDNDGCTGAAAVRVTVDCKGIHFPSAFTPNTDALNPAFGAIGDLGALRNYSIVIYDRYAQKIFESSDPFKKWDGMYKGKPSDIGTYVWTCRYTLRGQKPAFKKGTVIILH